MLPRIVKVCHVEGYRLKLTFSNGETGELNLRDRILERGGVFAPLEDVEFFKLVKVDPEIGTIVWPNQVDFCPDVLYSEVMGKPLTVFEKSASE